MDNNTKKEKRKFPRINAKFPIRYQIKRGGFFASALTDNVSLAGARLNVDRFFPQGINLNLELNILSKVINSVGKVIWVKALPDSKRYQMGVEFIDINSQDKILLSDYINTITPRFNECQINTF